MPSSSSCNPVVHCISKIKSLKFIYTTDATPFKGVVQVQCMAFVHKYKNHNEKIQEILSYLDCVCVNVFANA